MLSWPLTLVALNGCKSPHNLPKLGFLYITLAYLPPVDPLLLISLCANGFKASPLLKVAVHKHERLISLYCIMFHVVIAIICFCSLREYYQLLLYILGFGWAKNMVLSFSANGKCCAAAYPGNGWASSHHKTGPNEELMRLTLHLDVLFFLFLTKSGYKRCRGSLI